LKVLENFDKYMENDANLKKQLRTAIKANQRLSAINMQMLSVLLVYVTSNDFKVGAATLVGRLGDPQEALREMMKAKLRGD
jgi:hypothetical protein